MLYAGISCTGGESKMDGRAGRAVFNVVVAIIMVSTGTINTLAAK